MNFRELYDAQFSFVWRSLRRLGVLETDLGDASQEVFLVVHRKLAEFEGRSKITTWIFGICLRIAADRRRSAARDRRHQSPEEHVIADNSFSRSRDAAHLVGELLGRLPYEQRVVFVMFELEGFSGDEIAELLAVPVGTVRSRLRLARDSFRCWADARQPCETHPSLQGAVP